MGQGNSTSASPPFPEELAHRLTTLIATQCFTPLELQTFTQTFTSLADSKNGIKYWTSKTLIGFLDIPSTLESGGTALYHMCAYLGAFPFPSHAPAVLTGDALLRIVCFLTGRYGKVVHSGKEAWRREIWRACADFPSKALNGKKMDGEHEQETNGGADAMSKVKDVLAKVTLKDSENEEEDELAFHIFELLDARDGYQEEKVESRDGSVPKERFGKLLELLLLIAPLGSGESVSLYAAQLDENGLEGLRSAAKSILASFGTEENTSISLETFETVITHTMPHLLDSLEPLFEQFLFPKDTSVQENKAATSEDPSTSEAQDTSHVTTILNPLLPIQSEILNQPLLSQLSLIFSPGTIINRLQPLYHGHTHGYSLLSLSTTLSKHTSPTLLLVSGTLLPSNPTTSSARTFLDELPYRRLPPSSPSSSSQKIIYGAYIPSPTSTSTSEKSTLFQLAPTHDIFPTTSSTPSTLYLNPTPSLYPGLGLGSPLSTYNTLTSTSTSPPSYPRRPSITTYSARDTFSGGGPSSSFTSTSSYSGPSSPGLTRRSSLIGDEYIPLGPISLHINDGLEYGVFTHIVSGEGGRGGSFDGSVLGRGDWQDRFEIEGFEIWGVGSEGRRVAGWEGLGREGGDSEMKGGEVSEELLSMTGLIKDDGWSSESA